MVAIFNLGKFIVFFILAVVISMQCSVVYYNMEEELIVWAFRTEIKTSIGTLILFSFLYGSVFSVVLMSFVMWSLYLRMVKLQTELQENIKMIQYSRKFFSVN